MSESLTQIPPLWHGIARRALEPNAVVTHDRLHVGDCVKLTSVQYDITIATKTDSPDDADGIMACEHYASDIFSVEDITEV